MNIEIVTRALVSNTEGHHLCSNKPSVPFSCKQSTYHNLQTSKFVSFWNNYPYLHNNLDQRAIFIVLEGGQPIKEVVVLLPDHRPKRNDQPLLWTSQRQGGRKGGLDLLVVIQHCVTFLNNYYPYFSTKTVFSCPGQINK